MTKDFMEFETINGIMLINKSKIKAVTKDDNGLAEILLEGEQQLLSTDNKYIDVLREIEQRN